jgi:cytochrome c oxidase subunit 2
MTLGAGVLANTPQNMRAWIADPQKYKPGSLMPRVPLSDADLDALVTYLEGLK